MFWELRHGLNRILVKISSKLSSRFENKIYGKQGNIKSYII